MTSPINPTHSPQKKLRGLLSVFFALSICLVSPVQAEETSVDLEKGWNFTNGPEYPGAEGSMAYDAANKELVISYTFEKGGTYVAALHPVDVSDPVTDIQVEAKGPGGSFGVAVVDASGQNFIYRLKVLGEEKETLQVNLSKPSTSYGGAGSKTVQFPLKSIRLILEKNPNQISGKVHITKIAFPK